MKKESATKNNFVSGWKTEETKSKKNNKIKQYKLIQLVCILISILLIYVFFSKICLIRTVPTESMYPKIHKGDVLLINGLAYEKRDVERGDIIVFDGKNAGVKEDLVKRVVGLPGEKITFKDGKVYINDKFLDESAYLSDLVVAESDQSFNVPKNSYFVLGDNRSDSFDSRFWDNPYITKLDIKGRAFFGFGFSEKIHFRFL